MSDRSDPRLVKRLSVFASTAAVFAVGVGLSALAGWKLHLAALDTWVAAPVRIVPNAAACLVLLGVSLWLQKNRKGDNQSFPWTWIRKLTAKTASAIVCLVGLLSIAEHLFGWHSGIDRLLFVVPPAEAIPGVRPGLMATISALNFLVLGSALLLLDWKTRDDLWPAQFLSFAAAIGAIFGLFALVLQPRASGITMALPAVVTFFVLACGLVCSRPTWAVGGLLTSPNAGARLLRSVIPIVLLVLNLIGWSVSKALLTEASFTWVEASLLAIMCGTLLVGFITWIAFIVDRSDALNAQLERRVAERTAALRESEERLAGVIRSAMDAIITVDEMQRIVLFNTAAEKILGCAANDAIGQSVERFIPPRFHATHRKQIRKFAEAGVSYRALGPMEVPWAVRSNGEEFQIEASISQVEMGGKELFTIILRDVTERKRAEEALREQSSILDLAQVSVCNMENRIVLWNLGVERLYGFTREEAVGRVAHELLHTEFSEPLEQIEGKLRRTGTWEGELMHRKRDGERIVVSSLWVLQRDAKGEPARILKASVDITARTQAEEQLARQAKALARQTDELARSNADLEQFAYVASHDLQEPLRMVAAYTQLLGERYRGRLDDNADKFIGYICEGALRMQALIQDLLAFSRVGRSCGACVRVDCEAAMDDVLLSLGPAIKESGAVVTHSTLPLVWADRSQITQILQNLIGNAIKFRGNEAPVISLQAEKTGEQWLFSVSDNGIGIPPEYAEHIFVVFHRLHTRTEYAGNGIGLAICKKIVEHCGGKIWVEAQAGHGSIFKFTLPCAGPAAEKELGGEKMSMPSPRRGV